MDADDISHDIPVLKLDRIMKGKTMLDSKWVNALCAFIVPNVDVEEVTVWQRRYFAELINKHEGKLTHEFINLYWKQAADRNRKRIEDEKEVARLRKAKGGGK
jgi:hypothetical protein